LQQLPAESKTRLEALEVALQVVIDRVRGTDDAVFVKTTCRSAKDTALYADNFKKLFRETLSKMNPADENDQIRALLVAGAESLKSHTAKDVMKTFILSERVYQDLELAAMRPDRWQQYFVVRKWYKIDPSMEFRGFVANGHLNALSQYNYLALYPHLHQFKAQLEKNILAYFNTKLLPALATKFSEYVIDFCVLSDPAKAPSEWDLTALKIIELNPYENATDAALFSWNQEKEKLDHGPFELRLVDKPLEGITHKISHEWRDLLAQELQTLGVAAKK